MTDKAVESLPLRECGLKYTAYIQFVQMILSLPLRECGLKSDTTEEDMADIPGVTPLAGVWVEIISTSRQLQSSQVTPLAGVWVEITGDSQYTEGSRSLPLRECGLKYC